MKFKNKLIFLMLILLITNLSSNVIKEDFLSFTLKFSFDEKFQITRIQFPIEKYVYSDNLEKTVVKEIDKNDWAHVQLIEPNQNFITDIKNNFNKDEEDTGERVFAFIGVETGLNIKYFFKRYEGLWYLIKVEDFST